MNHRMNGMEQFGKERRAGTAWSVRAAYVSEDGWVERDLVSAAAAPTGRWDRSPSPLTCIYKNAIAPDPTLVLYGMVRIVDN
jgi:hypothetical protein